MHALTGRASGGYELGGSYPDEEVYLIVADVVETTGLSSDVILEQFGQAMVPGLLDLYGILVNSRWSFLDFLLNTEGAIHKGVGLSARSADPPAIEVQRAGPEAVTIVYRSRRRMCSVAKGIVRGAAAHYGAAIAISEDRCMHRGDPECLITVSAEA